MDATQIEHSKPKRISGTRYSVAEALAEEYRKKLLQERVESQQLKKENRELAARLSAISFGRDDKGLLNHGEILSLQTSVRRYCGIYFLILNGEIVYVGQSINIWSRIDSHRADKEFDGIAFEQCEEADLNRMEILYIEKYNPTLNRSKSSYSRRPGLPSIVTQYRTG